MEAGSGSRDSAYGQLKLPTAAGTSSGTGGGSPEDTAQLAAALRPALVCCGVPEYIYVNNRSAFTDRMADACACPGTQDDVPECGVPAARPARLMVPCGARTMLNLSATVA